MYVRQLALQDFRSWHSVDLELAPGRTVFVGSNGFGKTNLVEALWYSATLGSHRVSTDAPLVRAGADHAVISAIVVNDGREIAMDLQITAGRANRARLNRSPVRSPRELLGVLRAVLFAPEDLTLVRGDPGDRRRYLDEMAVLLRPRIAAVRADYDRVLKQRTALLKSAAGARYGRLDAGVSETLDIWDQQLAEAGSQLMAARLELVQDLGPEVAKAYQILAPASRLAAVQYRSAVQPDEGAAGAELVESLRTEMLVALAARRSAELERGVCLVGPHRDDLEVKLGDQPAKGFASHGESWSMALALRLACYELLRADGAEPVLLLDDVFAELDTARRSALAAATSSAEQVLVTAAVPEDIPSDWDVSRIGIVMKDDEQGPFSELVGDTGAG